MARNVWVMCDKPIHAALLGAAVFRRLESFLERSSAQLSDQAGERADQLERWACNALDKAPSEAYAVEVILQSLHRRVDCTTIEIALRTRAKWFLSQRYVVSVIDSLWRGGLDSNGAHDEMALPHAFSWAWLSLQAVIPLLNPVLWKPPKMTEDDSTFYDKVRAETRCQLAVLRFQSGLPLRAVTSSHS